MIQFKYYGDAGYPADPANGKPDDALVAILAPNFGGSGTRTLVQIDYQDITLKYDFGSMTVTFNSSNYWSQPVSVTDGTPGMVPLLTTNYQYDFNTRLVTQTIHPNRMLVGAILEPSPPDLLQIQCVLESVRKQSEPPDR